MSPVRRLAFVAACSLTTLLASGCKIENYGNWDPNNPSSQCTSGCPGSSCEDTTECISACQCVSGTCSTQKACSGAADCGNGESCVHNVCHDACSANTECH